MIQKLFINAHIYVYYTRKFFTLTAFIMAAKTIFSANRCLGRFNHHNVIDQHKGHTCLKVSHVLCFCHLISPQNVRCMCLNNIIPVLKLNVLTMIYQRDNPFFNVSMIYANDNETECALTFHWQTCQCRSNLSVLYV